MRPPYDSFFLSVDTVTQNLYSLPRDVNMLSIAAWSTASLVQMSRHLHPGQARFQITTALCMVPSHIMSFSISVEAQH